MSKLTDYDYLPIIRNRDEKGYILTYTVKMDFGDIEVNTLKEARTLAIIID